MQYIYISVETNAADIGLQGIAIKSKDGKDLSVLDKPSEYNRTDRGFEAWFYHVTFGEEKRNYKIDELRDLKITGFKVDSKSNEPIKFKVKQMVISDSDKDLNIPLEDIETNVERVSNKMNDINPNLYNGYTVSSCTDKGIVRVNENDEEEFCEGYFCQVFTDQNLENEIDNFCLAVGYEIEDMSDASLEKGIKEHMEGFDLQPLISELRKIAAEVRKELAERYNNDLGGFCIEASEIIQERIVEMTGLDCILSEGWCRYDFDFGFDENPWDPHTWVEIPSLGLCIDVTADQFNRWMNPDHKFPEVIVQKGLPYGMEYDEPFWFEHEEENVSKEINNMTNNETYKVFKHYRDDREHIKSFSDLNEALNFCYAEYLDRDNGHAVSIENSEGSIFEVNYHGNTEIDVAGCITYEEKAIIFEYMNIRNYEYVAKIYNAEAVGEPEQVNGKTILNKTKIKELPVTHKGFDSMKEFEEYCKNNFVPDTEKDKFRFVELYENNNDEIITQRHLYNEREKWDFMHGVEGCIFDEFYDSREDAIAVAKSLWSSMDREERRDQDEFRIGRVSVLFEPNNDMLYTEDSFMDEIDILENGFPKKEKLKPLEEQIKEADRKRKGLGDDDGDDTPPGGPGGAPARELTPNDERKKTKNKSLLSLNVKHT